MANTRQKRQKRERVSARRRAEGHKTGGAGTSVSLPEGVNFFSVKQAGAMKLEILPYTVPSGAGNPWAEDGKDTFERTFWAHRGIGPNNDSYVCPAKTANKPCPICEARAVMAADPTSDEETVKALLPKERQLWNVYDHAEPDKGVQVWDISFHLFGKQLDARINNADEDDDYEFFSDPEDGATLRVGFGEKSFQTYKFYEAESIDFKPRKKPLASEIVEAANVLDELLVLEPYDKLKAIFLGEEPEDDDDDDPAEEAELEEKSKPPAKKRKPNPKAKGPTAEDFDIEKGSSVLYNNEICDVIKISGDGTSLTLMDEDSKVRKAVAPDEVELIPFEDDEPEEKPKPLVKKKRPAKSKPNKAWAGDFDIEKGSGVIHDEFGACDVIKISDDGTSLTLMDEDSEVHRSVAPDEVELIPFEDDEPEEKPKPKKKTKTTKAKPAKPKKKSKPDPDDEDDGKDDEDGDDEDMFGDDDDDAWGDDDD